MENIIIILNSYSKLVNGLSKGGLLIFVTFFIFIFIYPVDSLLVTCIKN